MLEENNQTAERKICQPPNFMEDRLEATNFFNTCRTYLCINKNAYPTEEDKIIFILSFMEGGTVRTMEECINGGSILLSTAVGWDSHTKA